VDHAESGSANSFASARVLSANPLAHRHLALRRPPRMDEQSYSSGREACAFTEIPAELRYLRAQRWVFGDGGKELLGTTAKQLSHRRETDAAIVDFTVTGHEQKRELWRPSSLEDARPMPNQGCIPLDRAKFKETLVDLACAQFPGATINLVDQTYLETSGDVKEAKAE
jgi:hypothetical protein